MKSIKRNAAAEDKAVRIQYGALPYRKLKKTNDIEILLITSRETKRWIIPKGWPIKGLKPYDSAAQEAFEEAGVRGTISHRSIGKYTYNKRLHRPAGTVTCEVLVYTLLVEQQKKTWPEIGQRETRWFPSDEACAIIDDGDVITLLAKLIAKQTK
eukprot:gene2182-2219_t